MDWTDKSVVGVFLEVVTLHLLLAPMSSVLSFSGVKESPVFPLLQVQPRGSVATLCAHVSVHETHLQKSPAALSHSVDNI